MKTYGPLLLVAWLLCSVFGGNRGALSVAATSLAYGTSPADFWGTNYMERRVLEIYPLTGYKGNTYYWWGYMDGKQAFRGYSFRQATNLFGVNCTNLHTFWLASVFPEDHTNSTDYHSAGDVVLDVYACPTNAVGDVPILTSNYVAGLVWVPLLSLISGTNAFPNENINIGQPAVLDGCSWDNAPFPVYTFGSRYAWSCFYSHVPVFPVGVTNLHFTNFFRVERFHVVGSGTNRECGIFADRYNKTNVLITQTTEYVDEYELSFYSFTFVSTSTNAPDFWDYGKTIRDNLRFTNSGAVYYKVFAGGPINYPVRSYWTTNGGGL